MPTIHANGMKSIFGGVALRQPTDVTAKPESNPSGVIPFGLLKVLKELALSLDGRGHHHFGLMQVADRVGSAHSHGHL